jgi:hypothetical protein
MAQLGSVSRSTTQKGSYHFGMLFREGSGIFSATDPTSVLAQAMISSSNPLLQDKDIRDPTLFCTAFRKSRFYIFSRSSPEWV